MVSLLTDCQPIVVVPEINRSDVECALCILKPAPDRAFSQLNVPFVEPGSCLFCLPK